MDKRAKDILACPSCGGPTTWPDARFVCKRCKRSFRVVEGIPVMLEAMSDDLELSMRKWDARYDKLLDEGEYKEKYREYVELHLPALLPQIERAVKPTGLVYLEVGCGPFYLGQELAKLCDLVVGIDTSFSALRIARVMLKARNIDNYVLVQGNILRMPLRTGSIDLIYGGGVIEHFRDTTMSLREMRRVLNTGGAAFNTVPLLNLSTIYRQLWGNIPAVPVLRQVAEFIHVRLLDSRFMEFGYEMSFTGGQLRRMHRDAGFDTVDVERFDTPFELKHVPVPLRAAAARLGRNCRFFWPMAKVIAWR